jgi:hypothetical protein
MENMVSPEVSQVNDVVNAEMKHAIWIILGFGFVSMGVQFAFQKLLSRRRRRGTASRSE